MASYPQASYPTLPQGWQVAYTNEGQVYYVDHNTQSTHWTLPAWAFAQGATYGSAQRGGRGGRQGRVGIDQTKKKTKLCMNFESGTCSWGDRCAFAHGAAELAQQERSDAGQAPAS